MCTETRTTCLALKSTIPNFCCLFAKAWCNAISPSNVMAGFRRASVYPSSKGAIVVPQLSGGSSGTTPSGATPGPSGATPGLCGVSSFTTPSGATPGLSGVLLLLYLASHSQAGVFWYYSIWCHSWAIW